MLKKVSFRLKLFIYLSIILVIFTVLVLIFQYEREKDFRKTQVENTLDNVTVLIHKYIQRNNITETGSYRLIDSLKTIIPVLNIRITLIDPDGTVLYDSQVPDYKQMGNHLYRPEIQESLVANFGSNIRKSQTTETVITTMLSFIPVTLSELQLSTISMSKIFYMWGNSLSST